MNSIQTSIKSTRGFTLIELLTVILILLVLTGMIIGITGFAQRGACIARAKAELTTLELALDAYKADNGYYPLSTPIRPTSISNAATNNWYLYRALCSDTGKVYLKPRSSQVVSNYGYVSGSSAWNPIDLPAIVDPFKRPYGYFRTSPTTNIQKNATSFDLWSFGPDGSSASVGQLVDDITNWNR